MQSGQFGQVANTRKNPGCSELPLLKNNGDHCSLGTIQFKIIFASSPRCVPLHSPVSGVCSQFLQPHGFVSALMCVAAVRLYIDRCDFPNHVQTIEYTTGGQSRCRNILKMIKRNMRCLS